MTICSDGRIVFFLRVYEKEFCICFRGACTRRGSGFAMSSRMLKVLEFTLFYQHTLFEITPEGNRRKTIENEIPVKVLLDVDTVNIINEYGIEDDI